jgi:hypothetical protein
MKAQDAKIENVLRNITQIEDYMYKCERILSIIDDKLSDDIFTIDSTRNLIESRKFMLHDLEVLQNDLKDSKTRLAQVNKQMERNAKILGLLEKYIGSYYVTAKLNR